MRPHATGLAVTPTRTQSAFCNEVRALSMMRGSIFSPGVATVVAVLDRRTRIGLVVDLDRGVLSASCTNAYSTSLSRAESPPEKTRLPRDGSVAVA